MGDEWWDLCAGPHVETTGDIPGKALELTSVAGAYWRGDEKRAMLQRVYGTAWENADQLREHKRRREEAKKRDHRLLGSKLDLFSIQEDGGPGLVFWHPKGAAVRQEMESFWKAEHTLAGYVERALLPPLVLLPLLLLLLPLLLRRLSCWCWCCDYSHARYYSCSS